MTLLFIVPTSCTNDVSIYSSSVIHTYMTLLFIMPVAYTNDVTDNSSYLRRALMTSMFILVLHQPCPREVIVNDVSVCSTELGSYHPIWCIIRLTHFTSVCLQFSITPPPSTSLHPLFPHTSLSVYSMSNDRQIQCTLTLRLYLIVSKGCGKRVVKHAQNYRTGPFFTVY